MPGVSEAEIKLILRPEGLARGIRRSQSLLDTFKKSAGRSLANVAGMLKTGLGLGAVGAGGALFGMEAAKALKFEESLTRLRISMGATHVGATAMADAMRKISDSTGTAKQDVLGATHAFFALTGDAESARRSMDLFARVQRGTGAAIDDVATAAAAMQQNLRIDPAQFERGFSILIRGGKAGAIELKDAAGLLAELAPVAAQFKGGLGVEGLAKLGAALQLVRQGYGSGAEAATGLLSLMNALVSHAGKLEAAGVEVFDVDPSGRKTLRDIQQIVEAIGNSKLAKDQNLLIKALGRKEAYSAYLQLSKVEGAWDGLIQKTINAKDVQEDYDAYQQSTSGQIQKSWNELKNIISDTFTPGRIMAFGKALQFAVEKASQLFGWMSGIADAWNEVVSGDKSAETRSAEDDALDKVMKKTGFSLEQLSKATDLGWRDRLKLDKAYEGPDTLDKAMSIRETARRRMKANRAKVGAHLAMSPRFGVDNPAVNLMNLPTEAPRPFDVAAEAGVRRPYGPTPAEIKITMDPSTQNLDAAVANSKRHRVRQ